MKKIAGQKQGGFGEFQRKSVVNDEEILEVHRKLLMLPFKYAIIPQRWAKTIQIMLGKDTGKPWTTRLRIIELFDAQVNCGLQIIFGKRMVKNALDRGHIHNSAYGSVPKRSAQDAVMEKVLSFDMMRTKKHVVQYLIAMRRAVMIDSFQPFTQSHVAD